MITAGASLLHYRVVEKLGEGGMGAVRKATDTRADDPRAYAYTAGEYSSRLLQIEGAR
jgi:serine/threonine protein kinase